jgi:hypothetical protein
MDIHQWRRRAELQKVSNFYLEKVVDYIDTLKILRNKTEKLFKQKVRAAHWGLT